MPGLFLRESSRVARRCDGFQDKDNPQLCAEVGSMLEICAPSKQRIRDQQAEACHAWLAFDPCGSAGACLWHALAGGFGAHGADRAGRRGAQAESVIQLEIDRHTGPGKLQRNAESLQAMQAMLADVVAAVTDYPAMAGPHRPWRVRQLRGAKQGSVSGQRSNSPSLWILVANSYKFMSLKSSNNLRMLDL
jgi:hypothetical protein